MTCTPSLGSYVSRHTQITVCDVELETFKERISDPFSGKGDKSSALKQIKAIFSAIMLRRTKDSISASGAALDLPPCISTLKRLEFSLAERTSYEKLVQASKKILMRNIRSDRQGLHMQALTALLRLRQMCNHPALLKGNLAEDLAQADETNIQPAEKELDDLLESMSGMGLSSKSSLHAANEISHVSVAEPSASSTKMAALLEILRENESRGVKTIVFSQFVSMLTLVHAPLSALSMKFVQCNHDNVDDGSLSSKERETKLRMFKTTPVNVLLASLKCMSAGLNLVEASHIVMLDLWWNPAIEGAVF